MSTKEIITPAHIPDSLFVGYQRRANTLNGKLSFVSAKNKTGKLYAENQFNSWCSRSITKDTFPNEPMHGFYLNKRRKRQSSVGSDAMRVFHPLGFEFEIGMANICYILQYANVNMSEITSRCVLGWVGGKLMVIPENSPLFLVSYSIKDPTLQKVKSKLTVGAQYITKNAEKCIYLGEHDVYYKQSNELTDDSSKAFYSEHQLEIQKIKGDRYHPALILKAPIKQHLCYNIAEQEFFQLTKSALKFLCPDPVASTEEVENLLNDFKNSPYGNPTVVKYESNPEHIFNTLKNAYSAIFSFEQNKKTEFILGMQNNSPDLGIYIHTQYMENQIADALNLQTHYSHYFSKEDENGKRSRNTVPPLNRIGNTSHNFISYMILFKLHQRGIIKKTRHFDYDYDYSLIDLILPEFNKFRFLKNKENDVVQMLDLYPFYDDRFNDNRSTKEKLLEIEIFDLAAIDVFINDCVDTIESHIQSDTVFTEDVCNIINDKLSEFFESQKEKMMLNIDKNLKAVVVENETQTYRNFALSD